MKPKIICIISPIRFWDLMMMEYTRLSNEGNIVLLPVLEEKDEEQLMVLHRKKIDMSDEVFVINYAGYMGHGTYEEIGYASVNNKPVKYLEEV